MTEWLKGLLVGIVQGLTEFLPVSSSGHIELAQAILGMELEAKDETAFSVILHLATVLSTLVVLRREIWAILSGFLRPQDRQASLLFAGRIILSMIPAALVGVLFNKQIDAFFQGNLLLVGGMLLCTAALLLLADRAKQTERQVGFVEAAAIGIAQAIAILPGISRSGATISTAVLLKVDKTQAAHFSFLMVIPLVLGKVAKDLKDGGFDLAESSLLPMIFGFFGAFLAGLWACRWMINLVRQGRLIYFAIYCGIVGSIALGYALWG